MWLRCGVQRTWTTTGWPFAPAVPGGPGGGRRSDSPEILLGLYREIFHFSRRNGIRYWFSAMERALLRSMARIGFKFNPVGPGTDYYGPVTPFMSDLSEFKVTMRNHDLRL